MRGKFTKPNTESPEYKMLWANLNEEQRESLVKYNRISVRGANGKLYVIPYSRFHDHELNSPNNFYHASVQEFYKAVGVDGKDLYCNLRCGGIKFTHAAMNVLGIKFSLESKSECEYLMASAGLDYDFNGRYLRRGMTLRETYEVEVDSIPLLGELPRVMVAANG